MADEPEKTPEDKEEPIAEASAVESQAVESSAAEVPVTSETTEAPQAEVLPEPKKAAKKGKGSKKGEAAEAVSEGKADEKPATPQTAEEVFLSLEGDEEKPKILKAKGNKNVYSGIVHILATYNNTKVSVTDLNGNVIGWSSAGKLGFRGSRKSTAYASQLVSQDACRQAMSHGLKTVEVRVKGPGSGRESAVRAVQNLGIEVTIIKDVTPVPHNGCRPRKPRRV